MKYILYAHGGSANHGCEAIVRGTYKALSLSSTDLLLSKSAEEDKTYKLNELLSIKNIETPINTNFLYKIRAKFAKDTDIFYYKQLYQKIPEITKGYDIALSIGGDNYCYKGYPLEMEILRFFFKKANIPTILWGCSIDLEFLDRSEIESLEKYNLIVARESLTYESLKLRGFKNIKLLPDPAFIMRKQEETLPSCFIENNMVGINISPLIISHEKVKGIIMQNYIYLIKNILNNTHMNVALIPHVVWTHNDDRIPLLKLYEYFKDSNRVCMIQENNAEILKGYIAKCRFMIAARTHASIAAYSEQIPTIVIGYSIKSKGIAKDIFGKEKEHYVLSIKDITSESSLNNLFCKLTANEKKIKSHLQYFIPHYIDRLINCNNIIQL